MTLKLSAKQSTKKKIECYIPSIIVSVMGLLESSRSLLFCSGKEEEGEKESQPSLGEGGDTGELVPGKSLVFAAMELLVFILVRHLPQLNTRVKESPSHVPHRPQRLPEESARLVANTVSILAELPSLCSPAGEARSKHHTIQII